LERMNGKQGQLRSCWAVGDELIGYVGEIWWIEIGWHVISTHCGQRLVARVVDKIK
jgi:hypothetical protein